jgi:hypothetical protein
VVSNASAKLATRNLRIEYFLLSGAYRKWPIKRGPMGIGLLSQGLLAVTYWAWI